jgi:hypothetical protein
MENMRCLGPEQNIPLYFKIVFRKKIFIFGKIVMLFEGILGDFPPKMVPGIFLLKSELFFSLGWQHCGEQKILRSVRIPGSEG